MPFPGPGPLAAAFLAQLPQSHPPPPLPPGPFFERVLFEQPAALIAGFIVAAVVGFVSLSRNGKPRLAAIIVPVLFALAAAVYCLSAWVETPREQIAAASRSLIDATAKADTAAMEPFLAPDLRFFSRYHVPGESIPSAGIGRDGLLSAVTQTLGGRYPLKDHSVQETQASTESPTSGRTQVKVWVQLDIGIPNTSWWLIHWRKGSDGAWQATSIEPLDIPMLSEAN